jgi:uncharacterized protein (TIGR02246 family)
MKTDPPGNAVTSVVRAWIAAANSHDADAIADLYSPEAQLLYTWGELLDGQRSINHHFADFFRAFPDWTKEPYSLLIQGPHDWAVLEWHAQAAFLGRFDDREPTGRQFHLRGCGVFHVVQGRIRLHRRYLDRRVWYQQMGIT